jgi:hypothetical protein
MLKHVCLLITGSVLALFLLAASTSGQAAAPAEQTLRVNGWTKIKVAKDGTTTLSMWVNEKSFAIQQVPPAALSAIIASLAVLAATPASETPSNNRKFDVTFKPLRQVGDLTEAEFVSLEIGGL